MKSEKKESGRCGYMSVGQAAKKMGVTVRTLQYYDREGLLSPSGESEGGRRLYNDRDLIKLHQILSLKSLGFSLDDIKKRLTSLDTPSEVAGALAEQAADIKRKIEIMSESLREIELLRSEVLKMQSVDFKKYADIIVNLQMKNDYYWLIKHIDDQTLEYLRERFDKESGLAFIDNFNRLNNEIVKLDKAGAPPDSAAVQALAAKFWEMVMDFTRGDLSMLPRLMEINSFIEADSAWGKRQKAVNAYIESALDIYFKNLGANPIEEEST